MSWLVVLPDAKGGPEVSEAQIAKLVAVTRGPSNRPIQPLNGRAVSEVKP